MTPPAASPLTLEQANELIQKLMVTVHRDGVDSTNSSGNG